MIFARMGLSLAMLFAVTPSALADTQREYACGDARVVVWTTQDREDQHVVVRFLDASGKEFRPSVTSAGEFIGLCDQKRFLLLDSSQHHLPGPSWLLTSSGETVARFEFGDIASAAISFDHKLFVVESFAVQGQKPVTRFRVFDTSGRQVHDQTYSIGKTIQLAHDGKSYDFVVPDPDFPG